MQPQAHSDFPEHSLLHRKGPGSFAAAFVASFAILLLSGCMESDWPERDPLVLERAHVDSLEFLPAGSRFILEDSLTPVLFRGFRLGYACTRILAFGLEKLETGGRAGYAPRLRLELPSEPTCPFDSSARDSVLLPRFTSADRAVARLLDSLGAVLDTALVVRGAFSMDSLELKAPAVSAFRGRFFYRDTLGSLPRELAGDSLSSCEFLNHAEYSRKGDTTKVRFSWVTLDAASSPDSCKGPVHRDAMVPVPSRR